jgi:hypothetical protein
MIAEGCIDVLFDIKRVFFIYGSDKDSARNLANNPAKNSKIIIDKIW